MTEQHPITPPQDQLSNWIQLVKIGCDIEQVLIGAAQWGADKELEACAQWAEGYAECGDCLRDDRRPKPPSLKERALKDVDEILKNPGSPVHSDFDRIISALKSIPDPS